MTLASVGRILLIQRIVSWVAGESGLSDDEVDGRMDVAMKPEIGRALCFQHGLKVEIVGEVKLSQPEIQRIGCGA